jgi:hypothetical protein
LPELLSVAADLLIAGRYVFRFFAWTEYDRRWAQLRKREAASDEYKSVEGTVHRGAAPYLI